MKTNYFKLTKESMVNIFGITLYRLELTVDCKWGKKGDKGGWIESLLTTNGDARVSGDAWVYGNARVYGNAWETSPLQIQGTRHFVNICAKGKLQIGCHSLTIKKWLKDFKTIGEKEGYTTEQIKEYGLYIKLADTLSK